MEPLKRTVEQVMAGLKAKKDPPGEDPAECLKKILTKKELGHIKIKYFHKGILGLSVDSSVWLYTLSLKKEELLAKLNKENPKIKKVNFRIGEI